MPRKPGITRDELFKINADIARDLVDPCAEFCPNAVLGRTVNPVNSVVPAMAELYKNNGLDPMKIVGITTLDVVRASKFVRVIKGKNPLVFSRQAWCPGGISVVLMPHNLNPLVLSRKSLIS